jgi:hypothetical protein
VKVNSGINFETERVKFFNAETTGGSVNEAITDIPNATTLVELRAAITPPANATFEIYDADGITVATVLATGKKVIVTAQDRITIVTYTLTVNAAPSGGSSSTPIPEPTTIPSTVKVTSTDGTITLPVGVAGEVSLETEVTILIPTDASDQELQLTIEKLVETQSLLTNNEILVSSIFEILKNFSGNFRNPVTLTFTFNPSSLNSNKRAAVFYYDEVSKVWVEIPGGKIEANKITVDTNHFTKYAVLAVEIAVDVPIKTVKHFSDITGHWAEVNIKKSVSDGIISG